MWPSSTAMRDECTGGSVQGPRLCVLMEAHGVKYLSVDPYDLCALGHVATWP